MKKNKLGTILIYLCCLITIVLTSACSSNPVLSTFNADIPNFTTQEAGLTSQQAAMQIADYDLLHVSDQMKEFVAPYLSSSMPLWQRANMLNTLLRGSAFLNMDYHVDDTLTAEQAFMKESANCIGYANLYIALARHYGIKVKYQLVRRYPEWNRQPGGSGKMMSLAIHINSLLHLPQGVQMVVDVTPNITQQVGRARVISDRSAKALYYNNLAIEQFSKADYLEAYKLLAKAMAFDPSLDLLWVNLGAVYRHNNQLDDAELAYKNALTINPDSYTAMNNLAVLYQMQENWPLFDIYINKTHQYRQQNPYYHFQLAQIAEEEFDYSAAIGHVKAAIKLKGDEPEFHKALSKFQQHLIRYQAGVDVSKNTISPQAPMNNQRDFQSTTEQQPVVSSNSFAGG